MSSATQIGGTVSLSFSQTTTSALVGVIVATGTSSSRTSFLSIAANFTIGVNGTNSSTTASSTPTGFNGYVSYTLHESRWWDTTEGRAGIAGAVIAIIITTSVAIFLCLRKRRRRQLRVSSAADESREYVDEVEVESPTTVSKVVTKTTTRDMSEQHEESLMSRTRRWASLRERPVENVYDGQRTVAGNLVSPTSKGIFSLRRKPVPIAATVVLPSTVQAAHSTVPIIDPYLPPPEDHLAIYDVDNSSRNKYRMEDFDIPNMKVALTGPRPTTASDRVEAEDEEAKRKLIILRNRINGIREERDRLERIQELKRMERQAQNEIAEAQRRLDTG